MIQTEQVPQDDSEMNFIKRRINLSNWNKGLYLLKKELTGIVMTDKIIGLDPGMNIILKISILTIYIGLRDIFVAMDCSAEQMPDKKTIKENTTKFLMLNTSEMCSGFEWARKVELKNREAAGIQQVYDEIPVVDAANSSEILTYLRIIGRNRKKIFDFMKSYRHHETKAYLVQNRQITDNRMCDLVLGQTAAGAPYTLAHRTNSKKRKNKWNSCKRGKTNGNRL
ncbi:hypothetical protein BCV72DRAFT_301629 [Rhizopus microsporus var. microsporus]|uniref:Uncharacterized protein n=2 Tax=Rhizopus microsporus TaxID=58291 RepID=A0A2G4TAE8_RHIZD|nr:uncharacterized protein RHIMIDRAFT_233397 [Rhizopus microsporus ATCC 52813]ORE10669.1 hypothetical protein BCV72DRAFT_301629 [Rhizopus microsporus var. microsporus]PHZ17975.1 hypothetical protein RHIMIDRAFT_233397 [Rhizopus microsporus ATCC 52813]